MKKLVVALSLLSVTSLLAKVDVVVSILPQKTFVQAIGGDKVNLELMVKPGNSPHTYEPKPSQMKAVSKADIYFAMGVEFENTWLPKFKSINKNMYVIDLDHGIKKIEMEAHSHGEEESHDEHAHHDDHGHKEEKYDDHAHHDHGHHDDHGHKEEKHDEHAHHDHGHHENHGDKEEKHDEHNHAGLDPHVWTSPNNVKLIAKNIYIALVKHDNANKDYYTENYNKFIKMVNTTDSDIKAILKDTKDGAKFMVFHPAWGYFAKQYHLTQMAIEVQGKNPKPKQLAHLIHEAKEENVQAIFTAPEFSEEVAKQIARELNIPVVKVSPLNPKWSQNLKNLATAIANK